MKRKIVDFDVEMLNEAKTKTSGAFRYSNSSWILLSILYDDFCFYGSIVWVFSQNASEIVIKGTSNNCLFKRSTSTEFITFP